jgi:hypothetical protein
MDDRTQRVRMKEQGSRMKDQEKLSRFAGKSIYDTDPREKGEQKMLKGYDLFVTAPGSVDETYCRVCGTKCRVERNTYGPTGWIAAMARHSCYHDKFICPHGDKEWHEQALKLVQAIEETPSKRTAELIKLDLEEILSNNMKP